MRRRAIWLAGVLLSASACAAASGSHGAWLAKVPEKDRVRANPLAEDGSAVAAGALVFAQHCASCHGTDAEGIGKHPSLRTARVREASDGELQWLLRNGSLVHGMPAWSGLPEVQRWQVVRYLHSLPLEDHAR
jgi:mono/diheme cytochrome c family protein